MLIFRGVIEDSNDLRSPGFPMTLSGATTCCWGCRYALNNTHRTVRMTTSARVSYKDCEYS